MREFAGLGKLKTVANSCKYICKSQYLWNISFHVSLETRLISLIIYFYILTTNNAMQCARPKIWNGWEKGTWSWQFPSKKGTNSMHKILMFDPFWEGDNFSQPFLHQLWTFWCLSCSIYAEFSNTPQLFPFLRHFRGVMVTSPFFWTPCTWT